MHKGPPLVLLEQRHNAIQITLDLEIEKAASLTEQYRGCMGV